MSVNVPARSFSRPCRYLIVSIHTYKVEKNLAGYPINNKLLNNRIQAERKCNGKASYPIWDKVRNCVREFFEKSLE